MKFKKGFKRLLIVAVIGLLVATVWIYLLSSRIPAEYKPFQLTQPQREQSAKDFLRRLQDFGNSAQRNAPFVWAVSQDQFNCYLASMDEITAVIPGDEPIIVSQKLSEMGLAQPMVLFKDNILTFMISVANKSKVLSFDLAFDFTEEGKLQVKLTQCRLGSMPIPRFAINQQLENIRKTFESNVLKNAAENSGQDASLAGVSVEELGSVIAAVVAAVDSEPIKPELTWPIKKKRVSMENIELVEKHLSLQFKPIGRKR